MILWIAIVVGSLFIEQVSLLAAKQLKTTHYLMVRSSTRYINYDRKNGF